LPGKDGAHEKGGVEGDGGRFRRTHLVPVPAVDTLAELNARLAAADAADDTRHVDGRSQTVGEAFAAEAPLLVALPAERFDTALSLTARVGRYAQIMVRQCQYSVPARLIGARVRVALSASELQVFDGARRVATHPGWSSAAAVGSSWTTTWRSCWVSRVRCPARPRWPRPGRLAGSPRRMRRSGPPPATSTATPPALAP
jgi:hypothetical protein